MHNKEINVSKVANGFVLQVYNNTPEPRGNDFLASIPAVVDKILKNFRKVEDPIMADIEEQQQEEEDEKLQDPQEPEGNMYIFKTFEEVTEFLQDYFK